MNVYVQVIMLFFLFLIWDNLSDINRILKRKENQ